MYGSSRGEDLLAGAPDIKATKPSLRNFAHQELIPRGRHPRDGDSGRLRSYRDGFAWPTWSCQITPRQPDRPCSGTELNGRSCLPLNQGTYRCRLRRTMGCFGQSRLREFVLGGASAYVLKHDDASRIRVSLRWRTRFLMVRHAGPASAESVESILLVVITPYCSHNFPRRKFLRHQRRARSHKIIDRVKAAREVASGCR